MKVLQVNSVYKEGSTGKIVDCIGAELRQRGVDCFTCYGLGTAHRDMFSLKICSNLEHKFNAALARFTGIPYGGIYFSNKKLKDYIRRTNPDIVHIHCINAFTVNVYKLLSYLARIRQKTVITLHAEFFHTGSCSHAFSCDKWKKGCGKCNVYRRETSSLFLDRSAAAWKKMKKSFSHFHSSDIVITAVSPWLTDRARSSSILGGFQVKYVPNGIDTLIFHYRPSMDLIKKGAYKKTILFVAPYFNLKEKDLKGGRYLPIIASDLKDYLFIVVASRYECSSVDLPPNIRLWGKAKSQLELAQVYSEVDITLLLSERESFSMVTVESLCCGTPVVGFKAGGPESIAIKEFCSYVEYGDVLKLEESLSKCHTYDKAIISGKAISLYSQTIMVSQFLNLYQQYV